MPHKTILITGASGFIGQALLKALCQSQYSVRATVRSQNSYNKLSAYQNHDHISLYMTGDLTTHTDWSNILPHVDTIIHCAARAHVLNETSNNPLEIFREMNCHATEHLAKEAIRHKIKRFIFMSSIGVLGQCNQEAFTTSSKPNPQEPYAQAKYEAEKVLMSLTNNIEMVIIRPPLVYGPGVGGNFKKLLDLVNKKIPLPFGKIHNQRQFIGLHNLVEFILTCIESPNAANQTFLVADKEVVTTTQLIQHMSIAMNKKMILLPFPHSMLQWGLNITGKKKLANQLLGNLTINYDQATKLLDWKPRYTLQEQLTETVEDYLKINKEFIF